VGETNSRCAILPGVGVLKHGLVLEVQVKDFYPEELGRVVPDTPDGYVKITVP
jgi:hypothetical protein